MDSLDSASDSEKDSWIDRYLSVDGNEFLCEVDTDYIQDSFNLYGLREDVTDYKHALKTILDHYDATASDSDDPDFVNARELYGLIHQRYILTRRGLDKMVSVERDAQPGKKKQSINKNCADLFLRPAPHAPCPFSLAHFCSHRPMFELTPTLLLLPSTFPQLLSVSKIPPRRFWNVPGDNMQ